MDQLIYYLSQNWFYLIYKGRTFTIFSESPQLVEEY